ncbi:MAG: hypothetical protein LBF38_06355 [Deltaproteobacteria bacterium]|jgi:hypothetical protein|nr:hypothetical protein [Deltaproteobacteria bacterium]
MGALAGKGISAGISRNFQNQALTDRNVTLASDAPNGPESALAQTAPLPENSPEPLVAWPFSLGVRSGLESFPIAIELIVLSHELKQGPLSKKGQEIPELKVLFNRFSASQPPRWELPKRFLAPSATQPLDELALSLAQEITGVQDPYIEQLLTYLDTGEVFQTKYLSCAYSVVIPTPLPPKIHNLSWVSLEGDLKALTLDFPAIEQSPALEAEAKSPGFNDFPPIEAALKSIRKNIVQAKLLTNLLPQPFRIRHLQSLIDLLRGQESSGPNFRRFMAPKLIQTNELVTDRSCRPSRLFRFRDLG